MGNLVGALFLSDGIDRHRIIDNNYIVGDVINIDDNIYESRLIGQIRSFVYEISDDEFVAQSSGTNYRTNRSASIIDFAEHVVFDDRMNVENFPELFKTSIYDNGYIEQSKWIMKDTGPQLNISNTEVLTKLNDGIACSNYFTGVKSLMLMTGIVANKNRHITHEVNIPREMKEYSIAVASHMPRPGDIAEEQRIFKIDRTLDYKYNIL